jgi:hypothetical protein
VAGAPGGERRGIPPGIQAPDPDPAGRLGWEDPRTFKPCVDLGSSAAADQLLEGWYSSEGEGRWSWPEAELLLARPASKDRLRLRMHGVRREPGAARVRVLVGARAVLERDLPPWGQGAPAGAFELAAPLPAVPDGESGGLLRLRLERKPAYVPARAGEPAPARAAGAALAPPDHRRLGLFLSRVCVEADRAPRARLLFLQP